MYTVFLVLSTAAVQVLQNFKVNKPAEMSYLPNTMLPLDKPGHLEKCLT